MKNPGTPLYGRLVEIGTDLGIPLGRGFDAELSRKLGLSTSRIAHYKKDPTTSIGTDVLALLSGQHGYNPDWVMHGPPHKKILGQKQEQPKIGEELQRWLAIFDDLMPEERQATIALAEKNRRVIATLGRGGGEKHGDHAPPRRRSGTR